MSNTPSTLLELLQQRAAEEPDRTAFTFLDDTGAEADNVSYAELDRRARRVAASLQSSCKTGDRVLLLYPPGLEYIAAFFGCLYSQTIAVPLYPPRRNRNAQRFLSILSDSQASAALVTRQVSSRLPSLLSSNDDMMKLRLLVTDDLAENLEDDWRRPDVTGDTLAFLQYTSGSTSTPKGTCVTHSNLLHNEAIIKDLFKQDRDSIIVGWLPLYHDMGLIGNILQPLYTGARSILFTPASFLQRPLRWLEAISRYRATTSGGPNFAYDLCARTIGPEDKLNLDLSSWTTAFNGAEPINAQTLERFATEFEICGFRREAFFPCYGLAEATLLVSGKRQKGEPVVKCVTRRSLQDNNVIDARRSDVEAKVLVSCGAPSIDQQIKIVDPETRVACGAGRVGEIWISGPSVTQGYWNRPEETTYSFNAYLAGLSEGPFLRTGDSGFMSDGELYITGRLKDMIIIRGVNHYPQDIERTVENSHPALRANSGAAFGIEVGGEERLVVAQEVNNHHLSNADEVIGAIQQAVNEEHELLLSTVILLKPGSIPKTSSGKIQRHACRAAFLSSALHEVARREAVSNNLIADTQGMTGPADITDLRSWLRGQLASLLDMDPESIDPNQPITRYGLDSMTSLHLLHRIEIACGVTLPVIDLLDACSLSELERNVRAQLEKGRTAPVVHPDSASRPANEYPLSKGQQALWFLYQVAPGSAAYNVASAAKIDARLNAKALKQAFEVLVAEHPVLRTTFSSVDGRPVQRVHERMDVAFSEENAEEWSDETLQARLSEAAERPFDLEHGPLIRINLYHTSKDQHVLLLTLHHIITDFWSLALLARELGACYSSLIANESPAIARPARQFGDYVLAEERFLNSSAAENQLSYWERCLRGAPNVLNLPADYPRPPARTYRGASQFFTLNADLTRKLEALSRSCGTTLYTTLLSAFNVLLHRYTGQDDLVVGSPNAGRNRAEMSALQGYFVNTLVMRNDLSGDPTFTDLLDRIRTNARSAFAHADIPFSMLVEKLQPQRDASMSPLFNVMFVLQKSPMHGDQDLSVFGLGEGGARISAGGLTLESIRLERQVSHFDLTLMLTKAGDELKGTLKYSTDLFAADRIRRMAAHFTTILEEIASNPSQRISQLAMLPQDERRQLLVDWNSTATEFAADDSLARVFEEQARRVPGREAVIFNEDVLTYDELNRRANQVAHLLRSLGVGPEARVGLLLERSVEVIVGLLAILKAGAAYVPLDPAAPQERLAYVLSDAGVRVLLTMQKLSGRVPEREMHVISLDADRDLIALEPDENLSLHVPSESLAYIIYTSGSTGRPKGVMIQQRAVLNLVHALQKSIYDSSMDGAQRIGLNAPLTFDASVKQLMMLLHGHTLCLVPEDKRSNGAAFLSYVAQQQLNAVDCTPSHLEMLLATGLSERMLSQKMCLLVGGEPLNEHLWKTLQSAAVTAYNVYGPTECTVDATVLEIKTHPEPSVIGTPLANVQVYLLDSQMQPVPIGVPGELHIGGAGLARGYLNHPAFTAVKFIPNPFSSAGGDRLYRTGDMACYLADGKIKFLGRTDHQVKVRGYRIELGEIEEVLHEYPAVREAVVLAHEDQSGDKRLVAYVTASNQESPSPEALRGFLKSRLPDYMVPQTYVILEALPLTNRGKVDRSALIVPETSTVTSNGLIFAPRTAVEDVLANLFAELLNVEAVGIYDNFFELGGHSLLATRLVSQIQEIFSTDLPLLTQFFGDPTVAGLAAALIEIKGAESLERTTQIIKSLDELTDEQVEAILHARETQPGFNLFD